MAQPRTPLFFAGKSPWKYTPELHAEYPNKDWILTRILWLCGQEPRTESGSRDGVLVDSYARYIYPRRRPPCADGHANSLGCVRDQRGGD